MIFTVPITHSLCGSLEYTATYLDQEIGNLAQPMSYKSSSLEFTFFSMDTSLVGQLEFSLAAHLKDYPSNATPAKAEVAYITIADPCADAVSITPSTMDDQSYTITEGAK